MWPLLLVSCLDSAGDETKLVCPGGRQLNITGAHALGPNKTVLNPSSPPCPRLSQLVRDVAAKCNKRRFCDVSDDEMTLTAHQCPGVESVVIEVTCL